MISIDNLEKISQKKETTLLNISRDYLQALFLTAFYRQKEAADFFFKGDTALHLVFSSPRYSEDLDFSAKTSNCYLFENLLTNALSFFEQSGYKPEIIESKATSGGCLAIFETKIGEIIIPIKIEVSLRNPKELKGEMKILESEFLPPANILTCNIKQLVQEKVEALLTRGKPRDFFDLYFILRKEELRQALKLDEKKRKMIFVCLKHQDKRKIFQELKNLLPKSFWPVIKDLPRVLKEELKEK